MARARIPGALVFVSALLFLGQSGIASTPVQCNRQAAFAAKPNDSASFGGTICSVTIQCSQPGPCTMTAELQVNAAGYIGGRIGGLPSGPGTCGPSPTGCGMFVTFTGSGSVTLTCDTPGVAPSIAVAVSMSCTGTAA